MPRTASRSLQALQNRLPTLHTYRHLLREASYLPPVCQAYARDQIRARFRLHHHDPPADPATKLRFRRARHDLRHLRGANHGLVSNMLRILLLTYGRIGKRRRVLMHNFGALTLPADTEALAAQLQQQEQKEEAEAEAVGGGDGEKKKKKKKRKRDWLDGWDVHKLHALATSQARRTFWSVRAYIKGNKLKPEEEIPAQNSWGRPLSMRLTRSKLRKWYRHLIERLMPPVARGEWDTLRLLATGGADRSLWAMPVRRPQGRAAPWRRGDEDVVRTGEELGWGVRRAWDWRAYATTPVRAVERGSSRSQKARTGEEGEAPYGLGQPIGVRSLDRLRIWTRLYAKVFEMTPVMTEEEASGPGDKRRWDIEWGQVTKEGPPVATRKQRAFFEGAVVVTPKKLKKGKKR